MQYSLYFILFTFFLASCQFKEQASPQASKNPNQVLAIFPRLELKDRSSAFSDPNPKKTPFIERIYYLKGEEETFTGTLVNENWKDTLKAKGDFENGRIQQFISWYPNGTKKSKMVVQTEVDSINYVTTTWYPSGKVKSSYNSHSGKEFYRNGVIKKKWNQKRAVDYWENGNRKASWPLKSGKRVSTFHGEFKAWNPNSTLSTKGTFNNGRKHGKWVYQDSTGSIEKIIIYKNGKADSTVANL